MDTADGLSSAAASLNKALVEVFFPASVPGHSAASLAARKDAVTRALASSPAVASLLGGIGPLLSRSTAGGSFVQADREARDAALLAAQRSGAPGAGTAVMQLRALYLSAIYSGELEFSTAGIAQPSVVAPDTAAFVRGHWQAGPYAPLRYDRASRTLQSKDSTGAWKPFRPDVMVVGSGPAGSLLAHELRRGGKVVALVERGPLVVPGAMDTRDQSWLRESGGGRTSEGGGLFLRHGQVVGGGAEVNVDLAFSPTMSLVKTKVASWRSKGALGPQDWSERAMADADAWVRAKLGTRTPAMTEVNANNALLWDGARGVSLVPALYNLNTFAPGQSFSPVMDKRSPVTAFVEPALNDKKNPLYLLENMEALDIVNTDAGGGARQATALHLRSLAATPHPGVLGDLHGTGLRAGDELVVPAGAIVVSAGALSSPALLLRSKLGGARVGEGMVLHPSVPMFGSFDHPIDAHKGTPSTVYAAVPSSGYIFEAMSATPAYLGIAAPGGGQRAQQFMRDYRNIGGFGVMLVDESAPSNRVYVSASGELVARYVLTERDKARMRTGLAQGVAALFQAGATSVTLPSVEPMVNGPREQSEPGTLHDPSEVSQAVSRLQFLPGQTFVSSAHMQGTCKMHANGSLGVVGTDHHVVGTKGLYVVDASVFPASIGANPMMSIYAIAKIFADRVLSGDIVL